MNLTEARNAIYIRFQTQFPSLPTALDNQTFQPPTDASWARVNVIFNAGFQSSLGRTGNRRFEKRGILDVQVFVPLNSATNILDGLCQDVLNLYEGVRIDRLWFINGRPDGSITQDDGGWYRQSVLFDFRFDTVK